MDQGSKGALPYVALEHVAGGVGSLEHDVNLPVRMGNEPGASLVQRGDVLFGKLRPYLAKTLLVESAMYASTELMALRPTSGVDPRYLAYLVGSRPVVEWATAGSDGTKMPRTNWEKLGEFRVGLLPQTHAQSAIADFLDAETEHIDSLIAKKERMIELLEEQFWVLVSDIVWSDCRGVMPLARRTQQDRPIMYGIVLPGPDVSDGVPIVKGGDVAGERLSPARLNRTTREIELPYARARLKPADLVFAIRGGVGDVEVVPPELAGANITQDVARVAPAADVNPDWLRLVLRSHAVRVDVERRITGATIRGLNIFELKRVMVPSSGPDRQAQDLLQLEPRQAVRDGLTERLVKQIALLRERRQALITAAVTGELEIPGVAA